MTMKQTAIDVCKVKKKSFLAKIRVILKEF